MSRVLDSFTFCELSNDYDFYAGSILAAFVGQAMWSSGWEEGWTCIRTEEEGVQQQIEALGKIVSERPLNRLVDHKLRVMVDAHKQCCKDDRTFTEFYTEMVQELCYKPEHRLMTLVGSPICLTMPQDDFCCAMDVICGSLGWGTWRKKLTDEERQAIYKAAGASGAGVVG
ncbi:unnamed protein product [Vitrella brassicaformis CCMP3155]|uniref:Uncharacterized protein n=2 Tax=Vitrella brassicaformis TaxID=1169539 RepID=A0A0G4F4H7_VITBC|nr:unnamed protein product [Vitrella brassicaformis CCMP3155]|eukprot:CEM06705.1 unnamed protein product [Vitrella brassicaformis CCMP3155]